MERRMIGVALTPTTSLTVGSGSQVTGKLTAPTIDLLASGLLVTGDVTALKSLTIASGNAINGNVDGVAADLRGRFLDGSN